MRPYCRSQKRLVGSITMPVVTALMLGCAHTIPLKATVDPPSSSVQIPLAVGVYYSPEFQAYEHIGSRGGDRWIFPLGQASVALFDRVFPIIFESIVPVSSRLIHAAEGPKLAAVVEPRIEEFNFNIPFLKTSIYTAEITYRFTLYSPQGDPFASWTVKGVGEKQGKFSFESARWPGEAADLAMQDAATKFMTGFRQVPEVRGWLRQVGVRDVRWIPSWLRAIFGRG